MVAEIDTRKGNLHNRHDNSVEHTRYEAVFKVLISGIPANEPGTDNENGRSQ